jgi:hypothetical protein
VINTTRLYFIQIEIDLPDGVTYKAIKIGHSINPVGRLRDMSGHSPGRLSVLYDIEATPFDEGLAHTIMEPWNIRNEWFRHEPALAFADLVRAYECFGPGKVSSIRVLHDRIGREPKVASSASRYDDACPRILIRREMAKARGLKPPQVNAYSWDHPSIP